MSSRHRTNMSTNTLPQPSQTAVIYARVSSEEQVQGYSIQAQLQACRDWAEKHGYKVAKEYLDEGYSASRNLDKRESFKECWAMRLRRATVQYDHHPKFVWN